MNQDIITHPWNDDPGMTNLKPDTRALILGSFPPASLAPLFDPKKARIPYFYGSRTNRFWKAFELGFKLPDGFSDNLDLIRGFLQTRRIAVMDIVNECSRTVLDSSADDDLEIASLTDIAGIIQKSPYLTRILPTSVYTWDLLFRRALKPALDSGMLTLSVIKPGQYAFLQKPNGCMIEVIRLPSPSGRNARATLSDLAREYKQGLG